MSLRGEVKSALTPTEVLENGASNNDLAELFGISVETVKRHFYNIMNVLGYGSRTEIAVNELHKRYAVKVAA